MNLFDTFHTLLHALLERKTQGKEVSFSYHEVRPVMAAFFWTNVMASDVAEMLNAVYGVSVVSETRLNTMYLALTNLTSLAVNTVWWHLGSVFLRLMLTIINGPRGAGT